MREFQLIDDVMPDAPPADPVRTARVRARVLGDARRHRLPRWSWALAAAAVVSVLVAGFVAIPRMGGGGSDTASGPKAVHETTAGMATAPDPRAVLETAADRLAARPPGTGAWWRREMVQVQRKRVHPSFYVEHRVTDVLWRTSKGERRTKRGDVTTRPRTAADIRAWKKAGSPALCGDDEGCRLGRVFFTPATAVRVVPVTPLPTDAAELKAELLKNYPSDADHTEESWLWAVAEWLLLDTEATPGTRAATYRMLAALPGTYVSDGMTDADGRTGVALVFGGTTRHQLIVDRDTGELLALQHVTEPARGGSVFDSYVVKRMGWVDEGPSS